MGLQDRDYTRDSSYTGRTSGVVDSLSPVVKALIAVNVVVFVLQFFAVRELTPAEMQAFWNQQPESTKNAYRQMDRLLEEPARKRGKLADMPAEAPAENEPPPESFLERATQERISIVHEWLALKPSRIMRGEVWRLLTHAFCHDRTSVFHILFNMMGLYFFGVTLESMYGGREFLAFYLVAAVLSGIATLGLDLFIGSDIPAVGASGGVMAVLMLFAAHYPRSIILIWFIPVEARWVVVLYVLFDLSPVLLALAGDPMSSGIAHAGHLGGLAFGFLYWRLGLRLTGFWSGLAKGKRQVRRLWGTYPRIARPSPDQDLQDRVDAILKKLHESGVDSLTDEERRILEEASERLRQRRG